MKQPTWLSEHKDGLVVTLKVKPASKINRLACDREGRLTLQLKAKPIEGEANRQLMAYLAKTLDLVQRQIEIMTGLQGKEKRVLFKVSGMEKTTLVQTLNTL